MGETRSRAFPASYEDAIVCLLWFFRWDLLLRVEIPGLPEMVLAEVQHRRPEIRFPPVWLAFRALLWSYCSGILFPPVCLSCLALLQLEGWQQHPLVRVATL